MEDGLNGLHGALAKAIVGSKGTEPVTPQLLCLVELIVLETELILVSLLVMEMTVVLVRNFCQATGTGNGNGKVYPQSKELTV